MNLLASQNPLEHIVDHAYRTVQVGGLELTVLSKHVVVELIAAVLLVIVLCSVARRREPVPRGLANFFEAICQYLRTHVALPALGEHTDRFEDVFLPFGAVVDLRSLHGKPLGIPHDAAHSLLFPNPPPKTRTLSGRRAR